MTRAAPETALQIAVVKWLSCQRIDGLAWTAVNPAPFKTPRTAALSKDMGMRAGWPDLMFVYRPPGEVDGIPFAIELKAGAGRLSDVQTGCQDILRRAGCPTWTCRSVEEVEAAVRLAGVPLKARIAA